MSAIDLAWCHAISFQLPGTTDPAELTARYAASGTGTLWVERVSTSDRRLAAELALPAVGGLRAVLLCGNDRCDLVLAADRAVASRQDLESIGRAVIDGGGVEPGRSRPAVPRVPTSVPVWGLGGTSGGTGEVALGPHAADAEPATWQAALAVVLARYGGGAFAAVLDTTAVHETAPTDKTLDELVARFRQPGSASEPVAVGLVFHVDPPANGEYRAWHAPPFPLTIGVGRTRLTYEHDPSVAPAIAAQFTHHLARVHRQVVEAPRSRVTDVDLFDEAERRHLIALGAPEAAPAGTEHRIEDVFAARVAEQPDAIALCYQEERVTYRELDVLSSRIAAGLARIGVRPGDRVGLCLERSTHLVATMLAVLKAGCVYVPMDPAYPAERLTYTTSDAELAVVVTTHAEFPAEGELVLAHPADLAAADGADVPATGKATDPAYVIYTSGSTGRPKGVVVPHANVLALLAATRDDFGLGPGDVWTLFHSSAFDFSVWEIWGCLLTGGRLVVVPFWVSRSPEEFHRLLLDEEVTVLNQTPSAFSQLLGVQRSRPEVPPIRLLIFGGEPLDARMLLPWFDRHPETWCRAVNMFGITETTVHVTAETITRWSALAASRSVGRPLPGWQVHVLAPDGTLLPPGVRGEIYVGGAGVAQGYLNRPDLNTERFVPNPFGDGRLYRSGDAGLLRPDGRLEHLGRIDNQVKVRGFRIELDEIRAVLLEDQAVIAAAVVLRRGDAATVGIDAYVVLDGSSAEEVRKRAGRILPDYMVPASVTAAEAIPLTANGKVDERLLPAPASPAGRTGVVAQSDDALVRSMQEVWSAVLGAAVGPDDDFFELGGNSLLAVRIAAESRGLDLPALSIRSLYQHPTIRRLADAARAETG